MAIKRLNQLNTLALVVSLVGCEEKPQVKAEPAAGPSAVASVPSKSAEPAEAPPAGCKAKGGTVVELGSAEGTLHGLVGDSTHLYFATWQVYSGRGDVAKIRKDGGGLRNLTSLKLEPRDVAVDQTHVYYTAGIRLKRVSKDGGDAETLDDNFSSQSIGLNSGFVFGVPGNYGPYDRFIRQPKQGGASKELDVATRPAGKGGLSGYSDLAVDASGAYVTDSGNHRVLRFEFDRAKPKTVVSGQPGAYALSLVGEKLFFTLGRKGELKVVPKQGGATKTLASGLAPQAKIAADESGVVAPFAAKADDAPLTLARVSPDGGEPETVAVIPKAHTVEGVALDKDCIYWAQRESGSGNIKILSHAR